MKSFYIFSLFVLLVCVPLSTNATVVSQEEVQLLEQEIRSPSETIKAAVAAQYSASENVGKVLFSKGVYTPYLIEIDPQGFPTEHDRNFELSWKTIRTKSGITFQVPWYPEWQVLGKQISWADETDITKENWFSDWTSGVSEVFQTGGYQLKDHGILSLNLRLTRDYTVSIKKLRRPNHWK
jgi:hypothetical protein